MFSKEYSRLAIAALTALFGVAASGSAFAEGKWNHEQQRPQRQHVERHEHHDRNVHQEWRERHESRHEHRRDEARRDERRGDEWRHHERHEHSRRDQVNDRMKNQARQIHEERREGDLGSSQAKNLWKQEQSVRQQERADLAANDGHLTRPEQKQLNGELNTIESEIPR